MDKEILVIDTPNNCSECPCCNDNECGNQYKGYVGDYIGWNSGRPSWCQLKPLPQRKQSLITVFGDGVMFNEPTEFEQGYNACIDEILGGK